MAVTLSGSPDKGCGKLKLLSQQSLHSWLGRISLKRSNFALHYIYSYIHNVGPKSVDDFFPIVSCEVRFFGQQLTRAGSRCCSAQLDLTRCPKSFLTWLNSARIFFIEFLSFFKPN